MRMGNVALNSDFSNSSATFFVESLLADDGLVNSELNSKICDELRGKKCVSKSI